MERKSNIQISDIVYQLQQIDYSLLLTIIKPIVLYYIGSKAISTYHLYKDFKPKGISSINLPPEVTKGTVQIDKERLLEQQFGDLIVNFATTILEKMPNADLTFFYNNLRTITTSTKSFKFSNIILKARKQGAYSPQKNDIEMQLHNYQLTIDHELFHMSSSYYRESDGMIFTGFMQQPKGKNPIGKALNEGYTQLLTERYFGDSKTLLPAYKCEKMVAQNVETIIGKEKMEDFYLRSDLFGLVQQLKQYEDETAIMKFLSSLDFLEKHLEDKHLLPMEKGMITSSLKSSSQFLLRCYMRKLKNEFDNKELFEEDLKQKLSTFVSMLGTNLKVGKREFEFLNLEELTESLSNALDTFHNRNISSSNEQSNIAKGH